MPFKHSNAIIINTLVWFNFSTFSILTLEGEHLVNWGDYIIRGVKGELYPCKEDIFRATYENLDGTEVTDG